MWVKSKVKQKQKGAALITALFIMSLVVIIASRIAFQESVLINEASLVKNADQAFLALQGSQDWGAAVLANELKNQSGDSGNTVGSIGVMRLPKESTQLTTSIADANVTLKMRISNMQNRLNINAITLSNVPVLAKLLKNIDAEMTQQQALALAQNIAYYISQENLSQTDAYYLKKNPPHRAPHHGLADITELRAVKGMTPDLYKKISPYFVALPDKDNLLLNVNSMANPVGEKILLALPNATPELVSGLMACVQSAPLVGASEAGRCGGQEFSGFLSNTKVTTFSSQYFSVWANAKLDKQQFTLQTVLKVADDADQPGQKKIQILWQHFINTGVD